MVRRLINRLPRGKKKPDHHVDMRLGDGWHKRNFLAEVVIPSMFTRRHGAQVKPVFPELKTGEVCITWIGHASFLVQTPEHSVLIDPNWAKWLKVIKRIRQPGFEIHDLPAIDLVLVTHAHFDHLDRRTLRMVASDQPIAVPKNCGGLVHDLGFRHVHELGHWESFEHGSLKITLTPARHWGARVLHDSHRGFGGFLVEYAGRSIFHCGDSAYFEGFREIGERTEVEIALLPIGAYEAPTKRDVHMNPEQALQAFMELRARIMIPMHFGSFRLSYEPLHEPPARLRRHAEQMALLDRVVVLNEGEPRVF
ncbi:MAG: MBL fold metallo-hydrolase [Terrimicrobiaceae bacterium]|nr:MBL fold metallo-hydrolase [Terrimicrobiaceae bacterium]